jgi:hypothetical protein
MRKFAAIPLLLLILMTGVNITVSSHYCCGNYIGSKVSLSGATASCGMQEANPAVQDNEVIRKHCCDNIVAPILLGNNYIPTFYSVPSVQTQAIPDFTALMIFLSPVEDHSVNRLSGENSPPGSYHPTSVEQNIICVFRI